MKKQIIYRTGLLSILLALVLSLAACGGSSSSSDSGSSDAAGDATTEESAPAGETYVLKYGSNNAPGSMRYDLLEEKFADLMAEKTNGRITIEIYPSGSLAGPGQVLDAIRNGTVDCGYDAYSRYTGQFPLFDLLVSPGWIFNSYEDFNAAANEFVKEFPDAGTDLYKIVVLCDAGRFGLASTKPIRSAADIKGQQVRMSGSFVDFFGGLGASSVEVASGDMYEALRLNTITATNTNDNAVVTFHLDEVCSSFTFMPMEHAEFTIFLSQELYDSFDDELKAQVDEVCADMQQVALDYINAETTNATEAVAVSNPDFEWINLSGEEVQKLSDSAMVLLEAKAAALDEKGLPGTEALEWIKAHQSQ
jgi:TRAP-type C4-dicarboxylate transport system substrate-binding protein